MLPNVHCLCNELLFCQIGLSHFIPKGCTTSILGRGCAIKKGIDFKDTGLRNGINFQSFSISNGTGFKSLIWIKVGYTFLKNW